MTTEFDTGPSVIELATELTIAWLSNPNTRASAEDVPAFLATMRDSVLQLIGQPSAVDIEETPSDLFTPAVSVRKSLASKEHIISMIDGKPYKTLRRHLGGYGLTEEEYRRRYKLKPDYPMVAEAYSAARRAMAKKIGLGRKPGLRITTTQPSPPKRPKLKLSTVTG
ncbi:MucR family transcriptional regulator [Sphingomonas sp. A2-49]|jgi:predicted transcriptional regulator|uniref:MucR family transcriptional regulator n=1 Tax=Sphingomonas sp. A2-49 TaxID=1391375 RepID=UPI0021D1C2F4|nr:MucR family transcriptional regulator [Sphingomonas sp. A2-49]MCU6453387.1 MucR family transcriptional regulator [Sphingomonas sp. A2-49]